MKHSINSLQVDTLSYGYDALNRPVSRNSDVFGYNERSEVIFSRGDAEDAEYSYNEIGNLFKYHSFSITNHYVANNLNQYTTILRDSATPREINPQCDIDGNLISKSGSLADFFRHRFSTKYFDAESNLYYYGYRFYHPTLMRWLNRDPIEEDGGLNLYGFCGNRSCYTTDSFGLRISMFIDRKLNEKSINYRRRGTGRGLVRVELIAISMYCSRCIFKTSGRYSKIMYILSPDNIRWNRRLNRYNVKWGNPRSNLKERDATIAHEMNHWNSWLKVEEFIVYLNSLDGKFLFFCESKAAKLKKEYDSLVIDAKRELLRYDELNMNQGGMNK